MAENLLATWERGPMLHGPSATWSAACTTAEALNEVRETSGFIPYGPAPQVLPPIMGSGLVYPDITEIQYGVQTVQFTTTMQATKGVLRDMFCLAFNGLSNTIGDDLDTWGPLNATPNAVTWLSRAQTFSTVGVDLSGDGTESSSYFVDTAFPASVTLNIVANTPGSDGGFVTVDVNWLGNIGKRSTGVAAEILSATTTTDIDEFYRTQDCSFGIGTDGASYVSHNMVSASITFNTGASFSPETTATGESVGIILAPPTFTGSVTALAAIENTDGSIDKVLDKLEDTGRTLATKGLNFNFIVSAVTILSARLPVAFVEVPTYSDAGGIQQVTIPFVYAGDKTINQASALEVDTYGGTNNPSPYYAVIP